MAGIAGSKFNGRHGILFLFSLCS